MTCHDLWLFAINHPEKCEIRIFSKKACLKDRDAPPTSWEERWDGAEARFPPGSTTGLIMTDDAYDFLSSYYTHIDWTISETKNGFWYL